MKLKQKAEEWEQWHGSWLEDSLNEYLDQEQMNLLPGNNQGPLLVKKNLSDETGNRQIASHDLLVKKDINRYESMMIKL